MEEKGRTLFHHATLVHCELVDIFLTKDNDHYETHKHLCNIVVCNNEWYLQLNVLSEARDDPQE